MNRPPVGQVDDFHGSLSRGVDAETTVLGGDSSCAVAGGDEDVDHVILGGASWEVMELKFQRFQQHAEDIRKQLDSLQERSFV